MTALFIAVAVLALVSPGAALAAQVLDNPSFETGDLSGWKLTVPYGGSATANTSYGSYSAKHGSYFALLKTNGPGSYTAISQKFSASAGDEIAGWAFFSTSDYLPYDDNAQVSIISGSSVLATVFSASVATTGSTGWTSWQYTFTDSGMYTLEARIANYGDWELDSHLGLDGVTFEEEEEEELLTDSVPRDLKQAAIDKLSAYASESKQIEKAIKEIEESLNSELWSDGTHLDPKGGKKVFDHENKAVKELAKLLKDQNEGKVSDEALDSAQMAIGMLVEADRLLADTWLEEVSLLTPLDPARQDKFEKEIAKGEQELAMGDEDRDAGKYNDAISHYQKAWEHAQKAEKDATKPPKS